MEPIKWATHNDIIKSSDGKPLPGIDATRAQVAQIFLNAKNVLTKKEVQRTDYSTVTAEDLTYEQFAAMFCRVTKISLVKNGTTKNGVYTPDANKPDYYDINVWTPADNDAEKIFFILKDVEEETLTKYVEQFFQKFYKDEFRFQNATDFGMKITFSVWNSQNVYTVDNLGDSTKEPAIPFGQLQIVLGELGSAEE